MMYLHEVSERLKGMNLSKVGRDTGLSRPTLTHLRDMSKPRYYYDTVLKLSDYFEELDKGEG